MQSIKSYEDAERIAEELMERMSYGDTVKGNCFVIRKEHSDFTGSPFFKVSGSSEHAVKFFGAYGYTPDEAFGQEIDMSTGALAHFIFFPERKVINDALPVFERQLEASELALFDRLA